MSSDLRFRGLPNRPLTPSDGRCQGLLGASWKRTPGDRPADAASEAYDVFLSHASEDKDGIVRPLAAALRAEGLEVWYDEFELRIGDSLRRKIDRGIAATLRDSGPVTIVHC